MEMKECKRCGIYTQCLVKIKIKSTRKDKEVCAKCIDHIRSKNIMEDE